MIEYLFFNQSYSQQFQETLSEKGIASNCLIEPVQDAFCVKVDEKAIEALWDEIDDDYEKLALLDQQSMQLKLDDASEISTSGIYIQLANNQQTIAQINPDVMNRMLTVITMDELNTFISDIANSIEFPDDSPICQGHSQTTSPPISD